DCVSDTLSRPRTALNRTWGGPGPGWPSGHILRETSCLSRFVCYRITNDEPLRTKRRRRDGSRSFARRFVVINFVIRRWGINRRGLDHVSIGFAIGTG